MKYNRDKCTGCVRGEGRNIFGHKVVISGIHAFEYSVTIITTTSETIRRFPNGKEARRYFAAIIKKDNYNGCCLFSGNRGGAT